MTDHDQINVTSTGVQEMKAGDRIRIQTIYGHSDHTVVYFRYALGIFRDEGDARAGNFLPLHELYEPGPESAEDYEPNIGPYHTNMVPAWMDIPK